MRRIRFAVLATCLLGLPTPAALAAPEDGLDLSTADRCDFLDPAVCLYPYPNDHFTNGVGADRRLNLALESMPRNVVGKPVDPSAWNRNDGFSPGQLIVTKVPGLDTPAAFKETRSVPITDMWQTYRPRAPIVVIDADTGRRHLIWTELDSNADSPEDVVLHIRPGKNFREGHRYIVALRNLKDANGNTIPAQQGFRIYRDRLMTDEPVIEDRREHFESIFETLADAGIKRDNLYLAWDFTVASEQNLSERMLAIRDDAFAQLGDENLGDLRVQGSSPSFFVTGTEEYEESENPYLIRRVEGRVMVPCYLDMPACPPGASFNYGDGNIPAQLPGNMQAANFVCNIPRAAAEAPVKPSLYGHGLLGDATEVDSSKLQKIGNRYGFIFCATDWSGMSQEDIPNAVTILNDISRMNTLADRGQQGMLNFLYLGRAMIHPAGFSSDPAFQLDGESVIDTRRLPLRRRVTGRDHGRRADAVRPGLHARVFGSAGDELLDASHPLGRLRVVLGGDVQQLPEPDRAPAAVLARPDPVGPRGGERIRPPHGPRSLPGHAGAPGAAARGVRGPPGRERHDRGRARTIGARVRRPMVDRGRSPDRMPWYGIPRIRKFPFSGRAALVVGEIGPLRTENGEEKGTPPPPTTNTPNDQGVDPHGPDFSETPAGQKQIARFLLTGRVFQVCPKRRPCYLDGWKGPARRR